MIALYGTGICKGVGIAEAVVVSDDGGLESLPKDLLHRGLESLRRGERQDDLPSVVIVCRLLESASLVKLPGLKIAAVAAESTEGYDAECDWPAVIGVEDLPQSIEGGEIVVVDGTHGAVYIDPDAETLIHYQTMEGHSRTRRLFLGSAHLPAITQGGNALTVLGIITEPADASSALSEGADGLVLTESVLAAISDEYWTQLLDELAGKSLTILGTPSAAALREIVASALPSQVTIAVRADQSNQLTDLRHMIIGLSEELVCEDIEPAEIAFAIVADAGNPFEDGYMAVPASRVLVDARVCEIANTQAALSDCVTATLDSAMPDTLDAQDSSDAVAQRVASTVILASSIDSVRYLVAAGVDSVAVPPGFVSATKDLIRSIPASE
jgi:hypothetical protein